MILKRIDVSHHLSYIMTAHPSTPLTTKIEQTCLCNEPIAHEEQLKDVKIGQPTNISIFATKILCIQTIE
jgi:hypothetical protein